MDVVILVSYNNLIIIVDQWKIIFYYKSVTFNFSRVFHCSRGIGICNFFASMATKPSNIHMIRTGSQSSERLCIASYCRQFSSIIKNYHTFNSSFIGINLRPLGANKTGYILINFHFNIRGKLSILRWYK